MSTRSQIAPVTDLPPLRVLMGGAVGFAVTSLHPAAAQAPAAAPVELTPIPIEGAAGTSTGYKPNLPALPKLSQPVLDTPQSVNIIPRQLMDDQGITSTRDALRTVPGVSLAAGEAGAQGDNLTLRGFTARNDFFLDGMRDFGSYYRDPFNLESIEVLKGSGFRAIRSRFHRRRDSLGYQNPEARSDHGRHRRAGHRWHQALHGGHEPRFRRQPHSRNRRAAERDGRYQRYRGTSCNFSEYNRFGFARIGRIRPWHRLRG